MNPTPVFGAGPCSIDELEDMLSKPPERLVSALGTIRGDIMILGVAGKMGPTLARMARRASDAAGVARRVIGVSRFSNHEQRTRLASFGVETIAADLLDEQTVSQLPDAENVVYMAGYKFGAAANPSLTWAMNCYLPALIAKRYQNSRIAAFSSGNVYGAVPIDGGGSCETDPPNPVGEYAMSVLGRERIFEHFSQTRGTPMTILRLNYAVELRYGVLIDLALQVARGEPIDVTMGAVNVIWQGEANAMALESLAYATTPPFVINIAGPEVLRTRALGESLGRLLGKRVEFHGSEAGDALLNNGQKAYPLLGYPHVTADQMLTWTADWVRRGGATLEKPTHFHARDGKF
jgi:nucleoside-diphosphate-sugar epimerase